MVERIYIVEPEVIMAANKGGHDFQVSSSGGVSRSGDRERSIPPIAGNSLFSAISALGPALGLSIGENSSGEPQETREVLEAKDFIKKNAISIERACNEGYVFPPGHPEVNQVYLQHPLAYLKVSGKEKVYIPQNKYDELLLQEREAELIKLLVFLGAVRIKISQRGSHTETGKLEGVVAAGSAITGRASASANDSDKTSLERFDCREFELSGKAWFEGDRLDRNNFAWVSFEPSWEALIISREVGGCTKAAIELRENASFSSDKNLKAMINKIYEAKCGVSYDRSSYMEKVYLIEVEFSPLKTRSNV